MTIWPSDYTIGYSSQRNKILCSLQNPYTNVLNSFSLNGQILKTTQEFFNEEWLTNYGTTYQGMLLSDRKQQTIHKHSNLD